MRGRPCQRGRPCLSTGGGSHDGNLTWVSRWALSIKNARYETGMYLKRETKGRYCGFNRLCSIRPGVRMCQVKKSAVTAGLTIRGIWHFFGEICDEHWTDPTPRP